MAIPVFTTQEIARLRRVILDYEAGNLTNPVVGNAARQQRIQLNVFKIDSPATGGGKYNLKLLLPNDGGTDDDLDDTSDLAAEDLGKEYDAPDNVAYLGIYPPEVGTSDHNLDTSHPIIAFTRRQQTANNKTTIVAIILGGGGNLPKPQYKEMVYKGESQNQAGFGFIHATAMAD